MSCKNSFPELRFINTPTLTAGRQKFCVVSLIRFAIRLIQFATRLIQFVAWLIGFATRLFYFTTPLIYSGTRKQSLRVGNCFLVV